MTPKPNFKVTPLFNAEYLRNGMRCEHDEASHSLFATAELVLALLLACTVRQKITPFVFLQ